MTANPSKRRKGKEKDKQNRKGKRYLLPSVFFRCPNERVLKGPHYHSSGPTPFQNSLCTRIDFPTPVCKKCLAKISSRKPLLFSIRLLPLDQFLRQDLHHLHAPKLCELAQVVLHGTTTVATSLLCRIVL